MHSYMFASILPKISNIQGQQIRTSVYGDDIAYCADKLVLLNTYLISAALVRDLPNHMVGQYIHITGYETIVERINPNDEIEKPLPPPTKLNLTDLANVAQMTPTPSTEIDILGVVICCGAEKYASPTQNRNTQFFLTLWGDFSEIEGSELQAKMEKEEYLVILGRNIAIFSYHGLSLQTKFNTTIRIDSSYPQALELLDLVKSNKSILSGRASTVLSSLASGSFSASSSPLNIAPNSHKLTSIAEMTSQTSVGAFNVEVVMSISDEFQKFCVLECPEKKQLLSLTIDHRNGQKVRPLATSELGMEPMIVESGSSSAALALEPLMPAKKTKRLANLNFQ
ncbi:hypothetical protein CQW23_01670 [Capsicum baccatum]|uniref:Replication protein A OB domain-containing protein n=1 Tax=Capsicum baccatum TaxID=33114 RepID=A0A2G2XP96_CAPBA|nr:hypothetical protein CQW23_01670 [Capsicum baccatum]